jgi:hypothetical protein
MAHSLIRSAAYEPDPMGDPWVEGHQVLCFGDAWRDELINLYRLRWADAPILPVRKLNALAQAVVPGLVATGRHSGSATGPSMPWLYTRREIPPDVVMALVLTWVRSLAPAQGAEGELERVLGVLEDHPPVWSTEAVDLLESRPTEGGTADPERRLYSLLAEWLAARLAARPYRTAGGELRFRVVSREQGAELVSWPPQSHVARGRTWYYSGVVKITVQTVPFNASLRVHASTHIRRWATAGGAQPRWGRGATVLFDVPVPWPDLEAPRSRLVPNTMSYVPELGRKVWRSQAPAGLLDDLDLVRSYPEPADLAAAPEAWLLGRDGLAAGIVYSNGMGDHEIGTGLMPGERAELDAWIEEGVAPYLRRAPDSYRAFSTSSPILLPKLTPRDEREDPAKYAANERARVDARRTALRAALGGAPLEIEIFWRHEKTRDELITTVHRLLGFPVVGALPAAEDQTWRVGGIAIRIRSAPLGVLGDPLTLPEGARAQALSQAVRARRAEVLAHIGDQNDQAIPTLAFVEIGKRDLYPSPAKDPKHALRLGFAHAGRLTQFIQDADHAEATLEMRARSACLDGFRQLGSNTLPTHRGGTQVPKDLQYVGLWMVRRNAANPTRQAARRLIAVRVRPGEAEYPVCAWDELTCDWVPYPRLLLTLARETEAYDAEAGTDEESVDERLGRAIQRQIRALLYDVQDRPTLLLVNSGNLRKAWPSLSNGRLIKDMLQFGKERHQRVSAYGAELRMVLIRDRNSREETAQWYAMGGGDPGFASGVWSPEGAEPDNRVYLSTTDVPPMNLKRGMRKLFPDPQWPNTPRKTAWNPQALELTVLGCLSRTALTAMQRDDVPPDEPATWAAVAHQSRFHDDYQPLSHPMAQHLAALAEEYVLPSHGTSD